MFHFFLDRRLTSQSSSLDADLRLYTYSIYKTLNFSKGLDGNILTILINFDFILKAILSLTQRAFIFQLLVNSPSYFPEDSCRRGLKRWLYIFFSF